MSRRKNLGVRVLKAVSSPLRLKMLTLFLERGPLSYTEIMNLLRLSPVRDAGRFAYHLKQLLKMDLIEPDVETRKYRLTELGRKIIDFTDELEEAAYDKRRMLVRTSRLAIEDFDRNKIAESLIKEAEVPAELAQKIARETEKRLQEIGTKYLTAPLIREFVNAILVERSLEEYRHKLTRLGLPVYDVTNIIKKASSAGLDIETVHKAAGNAVIGEYTLLSILPRDVADAHLSGALHLNNLGHWILMPNEFLHDLRFFMKVGLRVEKPSIPLSSPPPRNFRSALSMTADILRLAFAELSGGQTIDFFNVFLAPFVKGLKLDEVKEQLRLFMVEVNHTAPRDVCLGVELTIPHFLAESQAVGKNGEALGVYSDFVEESRLLASALLEVMLEEAKPILNPRLIFKVRPEVLQEDDCERLLYDAHRLMAEREAVFFANLSPSSEVFASYTAAGSRFADDWRGDWELDTVRTGSIDSVILNVPRAFYESEGKESAFFENLYDVSEKALRALEMKYLLIGRRVKEGLLPFFTQERGDPYCRLEGALRQINLVGLNEAVELLGGKDICRDKEAESLADEIFEYLSKTVREYAGRYDARYALSLTPNLEASERLASLDVERYGWGVVKVQGDKNRPFYTHATVIPNASEIPLENYLSLEGKFHRLTPGGHLAMLPVGDTPADPEELFSTTRKIVGMHSVGFYTYNVGIVYCRNCQKTFRGNLVKCPVCGSVNTVARLSPRFTQAVGI